MSWDFKGHKSFGRAQGRWGKGGKLRAADGKKLDMKDITGLPSAAILTWGKIA